ncbi:esterase/lipase family protein [Actinophytocola algeriensis]|uniref:Triacylglycerol esterase/lipase EstA (Alpha/beta hydrolase family) n=1 Tax=Actinophytocola algeriensis TaxID=1768010 RepID=A0A7W7VF80_9PSEU|nr:alpha/beta fold hydrolase [Actinophytocola algeriensis]MBB4907889.1 triacylglycerol esterase/lipase EstA (alpha/beta hydrolase family) [Actinophytocola algeriensis]MBE1479919.1 triacylglycerol esterase/lipase EstA (alpha/beta hydrolase family) [Actinophytocola algeriensis]
MTHRRVLSTVAVSIAVAASTLGAGSPATADPGPELHSFVVAFGHSITHPDLDPPGANDWSCRPSAKHPRPVVLVHGTWENRYNNFAQLSPALKRDGYCVFALNYGDTDDNLLSQPEFIKGNGDIRASAKELATFVDRVRAATGTAKVDIVGHSQGGMMPRQYLRFDGGAGKVATLVTLGATHHGTTLSGIGTFVDTLGLLGFTPPVLGAAAAQQVAGSAFLTTLNAGGDTVPGVSYVVIATRYDEVTTPYRSTFLTAGPGATVTNITLQDGCPIDLSDHLSMTYSWRAVGHVRRALDPAAPPPPCLPNAPVV